MKNRGLLILLMLAFSTDIIAANVCVISLLNPKSREGRMVSSVFKYDKNVVVLDRPEIKEIKKCFQGDFNEVVWVSHSLSLGFKNKYVAPVHLSKNGKKNPLYTRFFVNLAKELDANNEILLRVAFCGVNDKLPTSMDSLIRKVKRNGGKIDFSKKSRIASFLTKKSVTNLTMKWLGKSADVFSFKKWRTDSNGNCNEDNEYFEDGCTRQGAFWVIPLLIVSPPL